MKIINKSFRNKLFGITAFAVAIIIALASCGSSSLGDPSSPEIPENVNPENPDTGKPNPGKPGTENPDLENPDPENPDTENPDPEIKYFTVKFDSDGGSSNPINQKVQEGNKAVEPIGVIKELPGLYRGSSPMGTLVGWYNEDSKWDFNAPVNDDITLKAEWEFPNLVDVSKQKGDNIVEKAVYYIKGAEVYTGGHTLFLDTDLGIKPQKLDEELFALTIVGFGGVRTIRLADGQSGALFFLGDEETHSIPVGLTLEKNIILEGKTNNTDSVVILNSSNAQFLMRSGSKITGNSINLNGINGTNPINKAAAIGIINGTFTMEGGEITGNSSGKVHGSSQTKYGFYTTSSAVTVFHEGSFVMSGGSIYGNTGGAAEVVYIMGSQKIPVNTGAVLSLSGGAWIRSMALATEEKWTEKVINIASDWNPGAQIILNFSGTDPHGSILGRFNSTNPWLKADSASIGKLKLGEYFNDSTSAAVPDNYSISSGGKLVK